MVVALGAICLFTFAALALVPSWRSSAAANTPDAPPASDETAAQKDDKKPDDKGVQLLSYNQGGQTAPVSYQADAFGVTPPIRDLPEFRVSQKFVGEPVIRAGNNKVQVERTLPGWDKPTDDPLAAKSRATDATNAPLAMPGPSLTFNGVLSNDLLTTFGTTSMPPDTVGDVGPNHYVQATNIGVFRIFDKTGTALNVNTRISTLFSSLPASNKCRTVDNGDPVVLYDPLADRWMISQFALSGASGEGFAPSYECIAISQTGDPTGAYFAYGFRSPNDHFLDYPHLGVWTNGYYMATHQFNSPGTAYVEGGFWAFNRDKMLVGDPTANFIYIGRSADFGHMPLDIDGNVPPAAGTPAMFFSNSADEFGGADSILSYEFVPDYNVPANSTLTVKPAVATAAFDPRDPTGRNEIEQPAPATAAQGLDSISSRFMQRVGYRNLGTVAAPVNSYVMNWTVNVSGVNPTTAGAHQAGVRWTEMRRSGAGAMSIFDQGTHAPDAVSGTGRNRWMGSIAQDYLGNLAIGFSRSGPGATEFPDIVWAGRTGGQVAAGTMNEGEATMFASTGVQQTTNGRWGDYSAMSSDPTDDCTFWYTQQWRDSANNGTGTNNPFKWSTRIGAFKFPSCIAAPKGAIAVTVTECSTGNPVNNANVTVSPGGFFRKTKADGTLVSNIGIAPDTYSVTASLNGVTATNGSVTVTNGGTNNVALCLGGPLMAPDASTITAESCAPANSAVDPGETVTVSLGVKNSVGATTTNLIGTLQTTGGVLLAGNPQNFGAVVGGGATVSRTFTFTADPNLRCGANIVLTLALTDGVTSLGNVTYTIPAGTAAGAQSTFSYSGAVVPIADNSATGSTATINVSGVTGNISDLNFRFDGTANTATATLAGVDHSWVGDLTFNLRSPAGTNLTLLGRMNSNAGANGGCNNDHLSQITLDDQSANPVLNLACVNTTTTSVIASATRRPDTLLSTFNGEDPNGVWTLRAYDSAAVDTGNIRAFSLLITPLTCCQSKVWTGAVSTDWNDPNNWSPVGVPTATDNVLIPPTGVTNEPTIGTGVTVASISLAGNRTLTVGVSGTFAVTNSNVSLLKGTVVYAGAASQLAPNLSYTNVTVNNAAGVSVGGNITVDGTLAFTSGILDVGGNTVTVSTCAPSAVTGGSATSYIKGSLQRCVSSGGTYNFPVGDGGYSPVALSNIAGTNQNFTISAAATAPVASGLPPAVLNRTWQLTNGGITSGDVLFNYLDGDLPGGTTESTLAAYRIVAGAANNMGGTVNTGANTLSVPGVTSFSPWTLGGQLAPTAVKMNDAKGFRLQDGNLLRWQSSMETQNLGFHVYREQGKERVRVTQDMVAGTALRFGVETRLNSGFSYTWFDAAGGPDSVYWIEDVALNGKTNLHGPVRVVPCDSAECVFAEQLRPQSSTTLNQLGNGGGSVIESAGPSGAAMVSPAAAFPAGSDPWQRQLSLAGQQAVKIRARQAGWHRVTGAQLQAAGLPANADAGLLQLYADGVEQPMTVRANAGASLGADGVIEFYATGRDERETDAVTLWLIVGAQRGLRVGPPVHAAPGNGAGKGGATGPAPSSFSYTVEKRERTIYFSSLLNGEATDNFFGAPVVPSSASSQMLNVTKLAANTGGTLEIGLQGAGLTAHRVEVKLNGQTLGNIQFVNQSRGVQQFAVAPGMFTEGANTVTMQGLNGSNDISLTEYIRLTYAHRYEAEGDQLAFAGGRNVEVSGFTSNQVRVFDITEAGKTFEVFSRQNNGVVTVPGSHSGRTLLAVGESRVLSPVSLAANEASSWTNATRRADFIILTPRDFRAAVEPLANARRGQGLATEVIAVEDIYDEWSGGEKDVNALRGFFRWAKTNWATPPRYVLLIGDASYDSRNYLGVGNFDYLPTGYVDSYQLETASDETLADFNNDGVGELAIGRIPARTETQLQVMVDKILNYRPDQRANGMVLVSDRNDGYNFTAMSNDVAQFIPSNIPKTFINREGNSDESVRAQILSTWNAGPMIVNYFGHGSVEVWTGAGLLRSSDAPNLTNGNRLPVLFAMTCLNGYFQDLNTDSLAEALVKAPNGGAVATWMSSALTFAPGQQAMGRKLYQYLYQGGSSARLGDAILSAKGATFDIDVRRTWVLFGDPTMPMR
jgi:subtilisin-like proprotein convertase family protein